MEKKKKIEQNKSNTYLVGGNLQAYTQKITKNKTKKQQANLTTYIPMHTCTCLE